MYRKSTVPSEFRLPPIPMHWLLISILLAAICRVSSEQLISHVLYTYENSNGNRIAYTVYAERALFLEYDRESYPQQVPHINLTIISPNRQPSNCGCPDLRMYHLIETANGLLKFERAEKLAQMGQIKDFGRAFMLAPFPGYCLTDDTELVEFYSPVLNGYRYDVGAKIESYTTDFVNFFRPVRVLGYGVLPGTPDYDFTGRTPPYIKQVPTTGVAFNSLTVRFDVARQLYNQGGQRSYVISEDLFAEMQTQGWEFSYDLYPGTLSAQNDVELIREKCGALHRCVETLDPRTGLVRPQNADTQVLYGEVKRECGWFLSLQAAQNCFPTAVSVFSYVPSYNNETVIYRNGTDQAAVNYAGYAMLQNFAMLKLS